MIKFIEVLRTFAIGTASEDYIKPALIGMNHPKRYRILISFKLRANSYRCRTVVLAIAGQAEQKTKYASAMLHGSGITTQTGIVINHIVSGLVNDRVNSTTLPPT